MRPPTIRQFPPSHVNMGRPNAYVSSAGYLFPLAHFSWRELVVDSQSPADPVSKRVAKVLPQVAIDPGQTATLSVRLERGAEITGRVSYDDGSPVSNGQILIYLFSEVYHEWQTVQQSTDAWNSMNTDDRGVFRVVGLPSGRYLISVRITPQSGSSNAILGGQIRPDTGSRYPGSLQIYYGDTARQKLGTPVGVLAGESQTGVDIHIPVSKLRTLSGTVAAQFDGHLLKEAALQLSFADDNSKYLVAHLGQNGTFQIPFVLDGNYIMTVYGPPEDDFRPGHLYKRVDIPINVQGDMNGISISLPDETPSIPKISR